MRVSDDKKRAVIEEMNLGLYYTRSRVCERWKVSTETITKYEAQFRGDLPTGPCARRRPEAERRAIVEEVRLGRYYRRKAICARYGISQQTFWRICNGRR